MSGRNGAQGPRSRLDALLTNLARAGWYSAPIHAGWFIDAGSDARADRQASSPRVHRSSSATASLRTASASGARTRDAVQQSSLWCTGLFERGPR
jgi:hypothetical protein